jgi:hypothetical protein
MQGQDTVKPPCGVSYEGCTVMAKVHGSTWYLLGEFRLPRARTGGVLIIA